jgi:hypothetical protein
MGLSSSKCDLPNNNVFKNELNNINILVNDLLNDKNLFKNDYYNLFLSNKCDEVTLINSKRLYRYPKFEVEKLNKSIFLIPNEDLSQSKKEMCHFISMHFTRILRVIHIIKNIYNLENNGDMSIGGILLRNIHVKNNMIDILSCKSTQQEMGIYNGDNTVDFSKLTGFSLFVNNFLTPSEKKNLIDQLSEIFNGYNKGKLKKMICRDIVENKKHNNIHNTTFQCGGKGGDKGGGKSSSVLIKVGPNNPILSWNLCAVRKKTTAILNKDIMNQLKKFKNNYRNTLNEVLQIVNELCVFDEEKKQYMLYNLNEEQLVDIEQRLKQNIIIFFIQSLVDYKTILNVTNEHSTNINE